MPPETTCRFTVPFREVRTTGDGTSKRTIVGHAAVYDVESELIGGYFREVIRRGAFDEALKGGSDVRCLFNHDPNLILGRTKSGSLRMRDDGKGLAIECDVADTQMGRDAYESIKRGDIDQMSFSFRTRKHAWTFPDDPNIPPLRELLQVELYDVAPVTFPAYAATDVSARSAEAKAMLEEARRLRGRSPEDVARELRLLEAESLDA